MWAVLDNPEADDDDDIEIVETPQAVVSAATASSSTASVYAQSRYYAEAFDVLKKVFKLPSFHDHQLGAIISYLEGHDVVCYFPTGGGKSLCFQLPALCQGGKTKGVTIVIVPLRALMEDQVTKLRGLNVDVVEFSPETTQAVKQRIFDQRWYPNLIYITPEKWSTGDGAKSLITELYRRKVLARFAVDEAHLLSTWGKTFRSEGVCLRDLRTEYPEIPIMAVTATATPQVQQEIMGILNLHEPKVFSQSANRPNLRYTILPKPKGIVPLIMAYIREKHPQDVGIVYCLSRKSCEKVAEEMSRNGLSARHYHAQVDKEEQKSLVDAWRRGDCKIIVATIAFGMGVDKPDVRFVIHHDVPMSIAGYLQETGRAGRDGKVADCVLYWNWAEKKKFTSFIDKDEDLDDEQKAKQKEDITEMFEYCHNQVDCRRLLLLRKYGENFEREDCQATCDNCLSHKDDTTITQDVTDIALSLVKFAVNVERSCTLVSKSNFILGFRGSNAKSVRDKGLVDVDGYGSGKQVEQQIVDRLYDELISRDIVESYLVQQPRTKYSNQYMKVGFFSSLELLVI
ncbi:ATP-dependent DNA helicase [Auriscalpium vulgare]|uniref:ATP-dependent DNA helicase n=1 Tax=Auriscalpium vulgare TaxID=40419 RepID=A0ACB8RI00_9AGAM|nr:ATP-dependent DNA helicase [Auriscalpium vulgare]